VSEADLRYDLDELTQTVRDLDVAQQRMSKALEILTDPQSAENPLFAREEARRILEGR